MRRKRLLKWNLIFNVTDTNSNVVSERAKGCGAYTIGLIYAQRHRAQASVRLLYAEKDTRAMLTTARDRDVVTKNRPIVSSKTTSKHSLRTLFNPLLLVCIDVRV